MASKICKLASQPGASSPDKLLSYLSTLYMRGQVSTNRRLLVCVCAEDPLGSSDKVHLREKKGDQFHRYHGDQIQRQPPGWSSPTRKTGRVPLQDGNHARKILKQPNPKLHSCCMFHGAFKETKSIIQLSLQQRNNSGPSRLCHLHMTLITSCWTFKKLCQASYLHYQPEKK